MRIYYKLLITIILLFTASNLKVEAVTVSGEVRVEKVTFRNRISIELVGDLYLPGDLDLSKEYSAIIVGHPFGGTKEQTAGLHAKKLAENGFIALAFDAAFYGESKGEPRGSELADIRVEDFCAAVDFLSNHTLVDKDKIGVLGICGAGGYAIAAAKIDPRMRAIATVSLVDMGERTRKQGFAREAKLSAQKRNELLSSMSEQRTKDFKLGRPKYTSNIPTKPTSTPNEFYEYYRTDRGAHPRATTDYTLVSNASLMNFYPMVEIESISPRPLLFIMGENASSVYFSEEAYKKSAEPKELYIVEGAIHTDLYDVPKYMESSINKLVLFFNTYL